ncbi:MAG TPA: DUF4126 domain-containing protein [Roseiflexaceae bacterium]|nr:DUF4126 domain-containing protein [Roseiflexaceae bacterium]
MDAIMALFSALGLSTAAGLNAYIPMLVVGLLGRYTNLIHLEGPYALLTNPWVLLALALIALLDLIGDKIPGIDHALHVAGVVIAPVAGAIVALAAASGGSVDPTLAAVAGLVAAGLTHGTRMAARPVATAATIGTANPVISALEDGLSLVMSIVAIALPILAIVLVIAFAAVVWWIIGRLRARAAAMRR